MNTDELEFYKKVTEIKKQVSQLNEALIDVVIQRLPQDQSIDFQASIISSIALTFHNSMRTVLERMGATKFIHLNHELVNQAEEVLDLEERYNGDSTI
jgi:uncharacterized protein YydD (DUF2326 family)